MLEDVTGKCICTCVLMFMLSWHYSVLSLAAGDIICCSPPGSFNTANGPLPDPHYI